MKLLVTGGTGYVGSAMRALLKDQGHEVRLLVRESGTRRRIGDDDFDIVSGDILDTNTCLRACDGMEAVVHLVGIIREFPSRGITFRNLHTSATFFIIDAAKRSGVRRFIHMSALGSREGAASMYHRTKFEAEEIVRGSPLQWTIFRPSVIFGGGSEFLATLVDLVKKRMVPMIGGGKGRLQPVALNDVSACMAGALAMPETVGQTYELGGPEQLTFRQMVEAVAQAMGSRIRTVDVPLWAVAPVVRLLEGLPDFPLTTDQLAMLREDNICDVSPFARTFNLTPQSFLNALPDLVR
jgi:NADH dehydrogenase